jgi:hypothetical protein
MTKLKKIILKVDALIAVLSLLMGVKIIPP